MRMFQLNTLHLTTLSQFCDYDLCNTCTKSPVSSPPSDRVCSPRLLLAARSPFRRTLLTPIQPFQSPMRDIAFIQISSDDSPLPPPLKIHPFFIQREAQLANETHEMRFYALARQPALQTAPPLRLATGRLRLRVSTPVFPPQVAHTASAPRRQHSRTRLSTPYCMTPLQYPDLAGLTISTPPRVGCPHFQPRLLFPDSPLPSPVMVANVAVQCDLQVADIAVQCDPQPVAVAQPSPEPLTLQHFQNELQTLRNELRVLVMGFGF
jgi:hypothetical protein